MELTRMVWHLSGIRPAGSLRRPTWIRALALAAALGAIAAGCASGHRLADKTERLASTGKVRVGEAAPWLSGWTLNRQTLNLNDLLAGPDTDRLALVFFATWCEPCKQTAGDRRGQARPSFPPDPPLGNWT